MSDATALSLNIAAEVDELRHHYRFHDDIAVSAFLAAHPQLLSLLSETANQVYDFFPQDTVLDLDIFDDPEEDGPDIKLYAVILSGLPIHEARLRLYQFRDVWWRRASRDVIGLVSLVVN